MEQRDSAPAAKTMPMTGAGLTGDLTSSLGAFMNDLNRAFALPDAQRLAVRDDFARGINALMRQGVPFQEILRRLHPGRLRGFYARPRQDFYPLDNGAKQYPITMVNGQMAMFRLSAALDAPVNPALLQLALTFTLCRFPHYATSLRRGVFWYYLRPALARYAIMGETADICAPIDSTDVTQPLFRVMYRGNRVLVELFHVLSDGIGGMMFLKTLLAEYYRLQGEESDGEDPQVLDTAAPPAPEDLENSFDRFKGRKGGEPLLASPALQISAEHFPAGECRVDQYAIGASQLKETARAHGVSVTALMSAIILTAARETIKAGKGRYQLQATVDLRRIFGHRTLRNFSWFGALRADAGEALPDTELAQDLHRQLKALAARDTLERNVSAAQQTIRVLRYVPLQWKAMVLRTAYRFTGDYFFTATLSNLGVINLQGPLQSHVRLMAAVLGPSPSNPYSFALATAQELAILSVTRTTDDVTMRDLLLAAARNYGLILTQKG
ncbi:MAG TPA: hypothetical protein PKU80_10790 [Candidatus Limiplasma sp.]|nr:hypothetical protein [Candidatus Limiplasma sp.]HRX07912.1 hypothetical protein [Candidatus Limiplasma sp.]